MDAGPHIGLGHLQRSLALAMALREFGTERLFPANQDNASRERVERLGFPMGTLPEIKSWTPDDVRSTLQMGSHRL